MKDVWAEPAPELPFGRRTELLALDRCGFEVGPTTYPSGIMTLCPLAVILLCSQTSCAPSSAGLTTSDEGRAADRLVRLVDLKFESGMGGGEAEGSGCGSVAGVGGGRGGMGLFRLTFAKSEEPLVRDLDFD